MNNARIRTPKIFLNKTKNEIKSLIECNIFNDKLKDIAIRYYVKEECQIDISFEYGVDRKTIKNQLNKVVKQIEMA